MLRRIRSARAAFTLSHENRLRKIVRGGGAWTDSSVILKKLKELEHHHQESQNLLTLARKPITSAFAAAKARIEAGEIEGEAVVCNGGAQAVAGRGFSSKESGSLGALKTESATKLAAIRGLKGGVDTAAQAKPITQQDIDELNKVLGQSLQDEVRAEGAYREVVEYQKQAEEILTGLTTTRDAINTYIVNLRAEVPSPEVTNSIRRATARLTAVNQAIASATAFKVEVDRKLDDVRIKVRGLPAKATETAHANQAIFAEIVASAKAAYSAYIMNEVNADVLAGDANNLGRAVAADPVAAAILAVNRALPASQQNEMFASVLVAINENKSREDLLEAVSESFVGSLEASLTSSSTGQAVVAQIIASAQAIFAPGGVVPAVDATNRDDYIGHLIHQIIIDIREGRSTINTAVRADNSSLTVFHKIFSLSESDREAFFTKIATAIVDGKTGDELNRAAADVLKDAVKEFITPEVLDGVVESVRTRAKTPAATTDVIARVAADALNGTSTLGGLIATDARAQVILTANQALPARIQNEMFRSVASAVVMGRDQAFIEEVAKETLSEVNGVKCEALLIGEKVGNVSIAAAPATVAAGAPAAAAAAALAAQNDNIFDIIGKASKIHKETEESATATKDAKEKLQKIRDLHDRVAFNDTPDITTVGDFISTLGKSKRVADARTDLVRKFQVEIQRRQAAAGVGAATWFDGASGKFIGGGEISVSLDKGDFTIKFQGMAYSNHLQQLQDGNTSPCSWSFGDYHLVSFEIKTKDGEVVKFPLLVSCAVDGKSLNVAGAGLLPDLSITSYGKDTPLSFLDPISGSTYQTDSAAKTAAVQVGDAASGRVTSSGLGMRAERSRAGTAAAGHNREPLCDILDSTLRKVGGASLQKVSDTQYRVQPAMSLDRDDKIKVRFSSRDTLKTTQKRKLEDLMKYLDKNEGEERKFTITLKKRTFKPGEPKTVEIEFYKKGEELVIKDKSSSAKDEGYKIFFKKNSSGSAYEYSTHNATKEESPLFGFVRASQEISVEIAKRDLYRYQQKAGRPHDPTVIVVKKNYETKPPVDKNFFTLSDIPAANPLSGETPPPYTSLRKERQHGSHKDVTKLADYQLVIDDYKKVASLGAGR